MTRKWHINQALASVRSLRTVLGELTLKEVEAALKLESETLRRKNILALLVGQAVRLNEQTYRNQLQVRYKLCPVQNPQS